MLPLGRPGTFRTAFLRRPRIGARAVELVLLRPLIRSLVRARAVILVHLIGPTHLTVLPLTFVRLTIQ